MSTDDTGGWGQPLFLASGAPDLDGDGNDISNYYASKVARRFTTYALAYAAVPPGDGYTARADNAPGITLVRVAGAWKTIGVGRFADATARDAAITTPILQARVQLDGERFERSYFGSGWRIHGSAEVNIVPSSISGTGATLNGDGSVTLATSGTVAISLESIFPTDCDRVIIRGEGLTTAAALDLAVRMRVSGADAAGATDYDRIQTTRAGTSVALTSPADASSGLIASLGANVSDNSFEIEFINPAKARRTRIVAHLGNFLVASDAENVYEQEITHKQATIYTGATLLFTGASESFTGAIHVTGRAN